MGKIASQFDCRQPLRAIAHQVAAWRGVMLVLLCSVGVSVAHAAQKGLTRAQSQAVFEQNENYAVIVGVDKYDKLSALNYAVADAERLADFFSSQGYEVELLTNYKASRERILDKIRQVGELATNGGNNEQGNVVFAYSGHGFQDAGGRNYLTTSATDPERVADTALSMADLGTELANTGVRQRVLFIDACRNDPSKSVPAANRRFSLDSDAEGLAILYSTRAGTLSWEDNSLGHGVFTHYLVQGLSGRAADRSSGVVTFDRLHRYVQREVKKHVRRRFERVQIPYIGGERTGEFVLAMGERRSVPVLPDATPLEPERQVASVPEPVAPLTGRLTVKTEPADARVRIMNIVPKYRAGIELELGRRYDVLVSSGGYESWREDVLLNQAEQVVGVVLKRSVPVLVAQPDPAPDPVAQREPYEPVMLDIPGGSFMMGSPASETGRDADESQHRVGVQAFKLSKNEATFEQYDAFARETGRKLPDDEGWGRGKRPVINVSWQDAMAYTEWLSGKTGKRYRLPTEAEWEYAARAGSVSAYPWGESIGRNNANCDGCGSRWDDKETAPVGQFSANPWGLHDMHGNVYEWTCSGYGRPYDGAEQRCVSRQSNVTRALRGGSWNNKPRYARSAVRYDDGSDLAHRSIGFRLAQD